MRIFAFSLKHESNSFAQRLTELDDFAEDGHLLRGEAVPGRFAGTNTEWGGLYESAARHDWAIVPSVAASATPSGPVDDQALKVLVDAVADDLTQAGQVDAVFAMLHGAMQSAGCDDVEGYLLERLRGVVGPRIPIAVTLDPHANVTPAMVASATLLVPYRTTPHVDQADTARRCGDLLARVFDRKALPRLTLCQPPQNDLDDGRTDAPGAPMARLLAEADAIIARRDEIAAISLFGGFPWGNISSCGPSVVVTDWGPDGTGAATVARMLAGRMWDARSEATQQFFELPQALERMAAIGPGQGPVILVDYADCPAGGSPGDNPGLLEQMLDYGRDGLVYGIVDDAAAAAAACVAGAGAVIDVQLGGKKDRRFSGAPLRAMAKVLRISDGRFTRTGPVRTGAAGNMGQCALLDVQGVRVAVASRPVAIDDQAQLRHFGIKPESESLMMLKAMNHFRADFAAFTRAFIYVESPGLCSHDWSLFDFDRVRRPIHPFDADIAVEAGELATCSSSGGP